MAPQTIEYDECLILAQTIFAYSCNLHRHILNRHVSAKSHVCAECGKPFWTYSGLKQHLRTHTGLKLFQCQFCPKAYAHQANLNRHRRQNPRCQLHIQCIKCGQLYTTVAALTEHKRFCSLVPNHSLSAHQSPPLPHPTPAVPVDISSVPFHPPLPGLSVNHYLIIPHNVGQIEGSVDCEKRASEAGVGISLLANDAKECNVINRLDELVQAIDRCTTPRQLPEASSPIRPPPGRSSPASAFTSPRDAADTHGRVAEYTTVESDISFFSVRKDLLEVAPWDERQPLDLTVDCQRSVIERPDKLEDRNGFLATQPDDLKNATDDSCSADSDCLVIDVEGVEQQKQVSPDTNFVETFIPPANGVFSPYPSDVFRSYVPYESAGHGNQPPPSTPSRPPMYPYVDFLLCPKGPKRPN